MSRRLTHAPIIETVIEFSCTVERVVDWESLHDPYRSSYPQRSVVYFQEARFQAGPADGVPPAATTRALRLGARFASMDGKQIVQCRSDGFFFNRLAPYTSFDDYLPEALRCWNLYREHVQPPVLQAIGLRTINRIPVTVEGESIHLQHHFRTCPVLPVLPEPHRLQVFHFVTSYQAFEATTKSVATVTLASANSAENTPAVALETHVQRPWSSDPQDDASISSALQELRGLKNSLFEQTLTEACLDSFQR